MTSKTDQDESGLGCLLFIGIGMAILGGAFLWGPQALLLGGIAIVVLVVLAA